MKINIDLCVRNYNGGPCIKVSNNKKVLLEKRLSEKGNITLELEDDFALPNKLIIEHHGKNMKRDTQINSKGEIFIQEAKVDYDNVIAKILAVSKNRTDTRIYVRGDKTINYGRVLEVMGMLSGAGFSKVALISEPYKN